MLDLRCSSFFFWHTYNLKMPSRIFFRLWLPFKGARYLLIIHKVLIAMGFFPAGVQDETLKEESQRLAIANSCHNNDFNLTFV